MNCENCCHCKWLGNNRYVCENPDSENFEGSVEGYWFCKFFWAGEAD